MEKILLNTPLTINNANEVRKLRNIKTSCRDMIVKAGIVDNDTKIVTVSNDTTVKIWDSIKYRELRNLRGHTDRVTDVLQLRNGKLATCSWNEIIIWRLHSGTPEGVIEDESETYYCFLELPSRGLVVGCDTKIVFWNLNLPLVNNKTPLKEIRQSCCRNIITMQNQELACTSGHDIIIYRNPLTNEFDKNVLSGHSMNVRTLAYSNLSNILVSGAEDHLIKIWELNSLTNVLTLSGHGDILRSLILSNCGTLISSGFDGNIKFWKLANAECVKTIIGHNGNGIGIMEVMGNETLITCGEDCCVNIWSLTG